MESSKPLKNVSPAPKSQGMSLSGKRIESGKRIDWFAPAALAILSILIATLVALNVILISQQYDIIKGQGALKTELAEVKKDIDWIKKDIDWIKSLMIAPKKLFPKKQAGGSKQAPDEVSARASGP